MRLDPRVVWIILVVVVLTWATLTILSAVDPEVVIPPSLNAVAMAIIGAAVMAVKKNGNNGESG